MARGHLAWIAGDAPETESAFREALPLLVDLDDRDRESEARHFLGLALESQVRLAEAAEELSAAREGYRESRRASYEALASNQLGRVLRRLGRPIAAEAAYRGALAVAQQAEAEPAEASALHNLGLLAEQRGELEGALELFETALAIRRRIGPASETALVLRRLGSLFTLIGREEDGLMLLQEAHALVDAQGQPAERAAALDDLALARHLAGDGEQALADYAKAWALADQAGDDGLKMDLLSRRASVLRSLGRLADARRDYRTVLADRRAHGERTGEWYAL
jgi:tetratricopeptide (TPR) repeat protein